MDISNEDIEDGEILEDEGDEEVTPQVAVENHEEMSCKDSQDYAGITNNDSQFYESKMHKPKSRQRRHNKSRIHQQNNVKSHVNGYDDLENNTGGAARLTSKNRDSPKFHKKHNLLHSGSDGACNDKFHPSRTVPKQKHDDRERVVSPMLPNDDTEDIRMLSRNADPMSDPTVHHRRQMPAFPRKDRNNKSPFEMKNRNQMILRDEGENEDPRPYSNKAPSGRDMNKNSDRIVSRNVGLLRMRRGRRGSGGGIGGGSSIPKADKFRESSSELCIFFAQGKCQRGSECTFSHTFNQPRKLEVCKFYLNDCCTKRDKCIYMHGDFPCKYYHLPGLSCNQGKSCKFSHAQLDEIQRAVLKKYMDIPLEPLDKMQKFSWNSERDLVGVHRGTASYSSRSVHNQFDDENHQKWDYNCRVPSPMFEDMPSRSDPFNAQNCSASESFRYLESLTPVPSPQSMMCEQDGNERLNNFPSFTQDSKVLTEFNNEHHYQGLGPRGDKIPYKRHHSQSDEDEFHAPSHHRKKHRRSKGRSDDNVHVEDLDVDLYQDVHDIRRKSNKKSHSKHNESDKRKKKKKERRTSKHDTEKKPKHSNEIISLSNGDCVTLSNAQETDDVLFKLPKKQQELFLRIKQHQKETEPDEDSKTDGKNNLTDDSKDDAVKWYSSDEDDTTVKDDNGIDESDSLNHAASASTSSPLATLLRTICHQNSASAPLSSDVNRNSVDRQITSLETTSMVDVCQLAQIDLSDEVTKNLTSIIQTVSTNNRHPPHHNGSTIDEEYENYYLPKSKMLKPMRTTLVAGNRRRLSSSSSDTTFSMATLDQLKGNTSSVLGENEDYVTRELPIIFHANESNNDDINMRLLPFKPVPIHDSANEIDATISSHSPIEYKLRRLTHVSKVDYASIVDISRVCKNDPRFKSRKASEASGPPPSPSPAIAAGHVSSPAGAAGLQSPSGESRRGVRVDPRLLMGATERHKVYGMVAGAGCGGDPKKNGPGGPRSATEIEFRDPRLIHSRPMPSSLSLPGDAVRDAAVPFPFSGGMPIYPEIPMPIHLLNNAFSPFGEVSPHNFPPQNIPIKNEDPRLRFLRAHRSG